MHALCAANTRKYIRNTHNERNERKRGTQQTQVTKRPRRNEEIEAVVAWATSVALRPLRWVGCVVWKSRFR